ncbi:hypothetical protein TKK_0002669 [Trichogramma kaykai]|uniref:Adenylate kinase isoenzyme 6 homolog n=1 Tax=Trichogramma kaykai TaxID=54128 RepID=A0ABD2XSK3_9HYME
MGKNKQTMDRDLPNILITGTPGTGKSHMAKKLSQALNMQWIDVSKYAIENGCIEESDDEYNCPFLEEDKLLDLMEPIMCQGGKIVDYHSNELFPERWFDIVFVLRTDNKILYERLVARGYTGKKLEDNVSCEILQTILQEAQESYDHEIVHELDSNTLDQADTNVERILLWVNNWLKDNKKN